VKVSATTVSLRAADAFLRPDAQRVVRNTWCNEHYDAETALQWRKSCSKAKQREDVAVLSCLMKSLVPQWGKSFTGTTPSTFFHLHPHGVPVRFPGIRAREAQESKIHKHENPRT